MTFAPELDFFSSGNDVSLPEEKFNKEKFNDKNPSVKRLRSIVRNKLNPMVFSVSLEIAPDAW